MRELVVVGRPNSGKTLFCLNFAEYLGTKTVDVTFRTFDDLLTCRHFTVAEARRELVSIVQHKTRCVQSLVLKMPLGKTTVNFKLTDTCGISETIHSSDTIRQGMAQTLSAVRFADFVIHIIDLTIVTPEFINAPANIDQEIYRYGLARRNYLLLANKIDLPEAKNNLRRLLSFLPQAPLLPISALYRKGFKEVRKYVARNI